MFKQDQEFDAMGDNAQKAAGEELRAFLERYETLEAKKKEVADQQKEVLAEAKGRGYSVKALRRIIGERKRNREDVAEENAIVYTKQHWAWTNESASKTLCAPDSAPQAGLPIYRAKSHCRRDTARQAG